jgi:hypothetical protein
MKHTLSLALTALLAAATLVQAADTRYFEMRTYYAAEGKLGALEARFRDHTVKLFTKHGMENLGYFVPLDNKENQLIYFLAYPSKEARDKSWKAFMADPAWQSAQKASEVNGKLVARADSVFLEATDYSPLAKAANVGNRVFEIRTYTTEPGRLANLNARFRDHTVKLFSKHGMANIAYWTVAKDQKDADKKGAGNTLLYIIAHQSVDAAKASFAAFGKDTDWVAARKASEEKAGGSLTIKGGVKSLYCKATDYSAVK